MKSPFVPCPHCGATDLDANAAACPHCGASVASATTPATQIDVSQTAGTVLGGEVTGVSFEHVSGNVTIVTHPRDRIRIGSTPTTCTIDGSLAAILAAVRSASDLFVLTPNQIRAISARRPASLEAYRLARVAEWSLPHFRLDERFVALTLLVDQGEEAVSGRWVAQPEHYDDLRTLLASVPDPAVVVLGPPGSGKSTLLRRFELDTAIDALRGKALRRESPRSEGQVAEDKQHKEVGGEDPAKTITFFIQFNQYTGRRPGEAPPAPGDWLAGHWEARYPDLPALEELLAQGRIVLLLDALNEMPFGSLEAFHEGVLAWKGWLTELVQAWPGNRVVFSCRSLDYSASLSTPDLRVPQVQIELLTDVQIERFLVLYSPAKGEEIWAAIAESPQLEMLRSPYFLGLLVEQVEATGEMELGRAGLFTSFVRQGLRREIERGNPLFAPDMLLASRDLRQVAQWRWAGPHELPERGILIPKLSGLAQGMQAARADGESSQVRVDYDTALDLLDHPQSEAIVRAGLSISVLDEDPAADEVLYRHQLLQEYFAARVLARAPQPDLALAHWRAADIRPGLRDVLATLPPAETLPALPTAGWEETTILAAAMTVDTEAFVRGVMATNLALAGRCAAQQMVWERLSEALLDELRNALVVRSRDADADLRARIAAGLALGNLGDPHFERHVGQHGAYLLPPMVAIPDGVYPIGDIEPIMDPATNGWDRNHIPSHLVKLAPYALGYFAVTNAEWACFMVAGGYNDERWWGTQDARAWRRGVGTTEGLKRGARLGVKYIRDNPALLESWRDSGQIDDEVYERWQRRLAMSSDDLGAHLTELYPGGRFTEPRYWHDTRYNNPAQPVVGICWYESNAYCAWLSAQTGVAFSLPTEVEREAATRGLAGRRYAYGDAFDALGGNTLATHLKQPSPVGVFLEGDTPEGVSDLAGNTADWTNSLFGRDDYNAEFTYPYDPTDGREDSSAGIDVLRVVRGGSWDFVSDLARAAFRHPDFPDVRDSDVGFRLRSAVPTP